MSESQLNNPNDYVLDATDITVNKNILTLTLDRPEKKNAINDCMSNEIIYALKYANQNDSVRVVVIQANGDTFCAGADLKEMSGGATESQSTVPKLGDVEDISLLIRNLNKPVICKIQGNVFAGALMIVTNSTHAVANDQAIFAAPEIKRGIWPFMVMGGLFRVMPKRQGLDFIMRGEPIDAKTAQQYGLINQAIPLDTLDEAINKLAQSFTQLPPNTMKMGLKAFNEQDHMAFDEALPYLREQLKECLKSEDAKEGITAFFEKRQPRWIGDDDES
ncbi:MAG: enoyl-CoA hydratase-related protein [Gammaproteobacteria bacterium]|nr:enoyl-CoA hydratase-related protein [Gammaproteobacteria bacterium]MDC0188766.1 enoyl-CoA hydratase-related protein [Gammaproteobacteria bacterium]|tara:strand:+ start:2560 stop:3387 length:828 start_codon:yes stop_codon:yes gene_type:complete